VLTKRFGLLEHEDFRIHPHRGKGELPRNVLKAPARERAGLLDQLPAKLRGYGSYLDPDTCVVVLVDTDGEDCVKLLATLNAMLAKLDRRPRNVLFRLAIEETESWFIAQPDAVRLAFPGAVLAGLKNLKADAVIGAWERLAQALGVRPQDVTGPVKYAWAERIASHLDLDAPRSPSLRKFIEGIARMQQQGSTTA
jgi:hypothetical protein